ncbi:MAG: hypothetical protein M0P61_05925 [Ignavibacteriaceae bacterium]|jgi:hypothetical protein|nr:hypothetical protein [Ignavibacteriaceae bacterium]
MKSNVVKTSLFVLFLITLFYSRINAQQLSNPVEEEKVKLSGEYYWEEEKANTEEDAKTLAKENLIIRIINDFNSNGNISNLKSIKLEGIEYLIFKRGSIFRVTAFIEKTNVTKQLKTLREMGYIEVIPTDKIKEEKINISNNILQNESLDSTVNKGRMKPKNESMNYRIELSKKEENKPTDKYKEEGKTKTTMPDESVNYSYNQMVTEKLGEIKDNNELLALLNEYKRNGKLVYGKKESFSDPEKCDILILNPDVNTMEAYLVHKDKAIYNYLTKNIVTDFQTTFKDMVAIWIMYIVK